MKKQIAAGLLALAAAAGAIAAPVAADFTINEGSVPGAVPNVVVADTFNGRYNEVITVNPDLTFDTVAYANFGQIFSLEGTQLTITNLNGLGANGYGMYAIFVSSGVAIPGGFQGTSGTFQLFIDVDQNTTWGLPGTGAGSVAVGNNSDDYMIMSSSTLTNALGLLGNPGAFDLWFKDIALTVGDQNGLLAGTQNGDQYFVQPRPFHVLMNVDGDFDNAQPVPGTFLVNGDVSFIFTVSEPAGLALVGLALLGAGLASRRKRAAA